MLTDLHLFAADSNWDTQGVGTAAILGDIVARCAAEDFFTERGESLMNPLEVGKSYLIQTVTLYYVGRVARQVGPFVELEDASWVHWTGRLSTLMKHLEFGGRKWPEGDRKPRTEFVGAVGVSLASIVAYLPGEFRLPKESIR